MPYISLQCLFCLVKLVLIVRHMHHSACSTCYICPHIPCYMSALFSTCYLSVSTMQHIHQDCMYMHHTYIHLLSVVCYVTKNKKRAPWCKRFTCARWSIATRNNRRFNSYHRGSLSHSEELQSWADWRRWARLQATKLWDCEDLRSAICVAHARCVIPTLPASPAQLMRPGIGRNASCALGDCLTPRPKGHSRPRELWFLIYSYMYILAPLVVQ